MDFSTPRRPARPAKAKRPKVTISASTKRMIIATSIFAVAGVAIFATASFWVNWWWFGSMGYRSVLQTRYAAEVIAFLAGVVIVGAIVFVNLVIALRRSRRELQPNRVAAFADRAVLALLVGASAVVAVIAGIWSADRWATWMLWINGRSFGIDDPVFHRDVGFFIFTLPALEAILSGLLVVTILTLIAVAVVYVLRMGVNIREIRSIPGIMRVHILVLAGAIFILIAFRHLIDNYLLAYSNRGVVFGASYTDVHAQRLANWLLAIAALLIGAFLILNGFVKRIGLLVGAIAAWGVLYIVLGILVPIAVQQTVVEPSELKRERAYIENNIEMTRAAYGLSAVDARDLQGQDPVTQSTLDASPMTVDNVRLWDYRVIRSTYQQLQSFVPYYVFLDADVERYVDQNGAIQQVLLSAREIDQGGLPETAQTWTNEHLVYTHGYGAVVSPAGSVSPQGLPTFTVERIPPTGTGQYAISQPSIYFGESNLGWIATNTGQPEFSGLIDTSDPNQGAFQGTPTGSIKLNNYLTKIMVAANLGDRNILLSGNLTGDSNVVIHRNIIDRIHQVAPFLELDTDPYMVIADGRLVWIVDAYTTSDRFPHSTPHAGFNYVRNSVKVVIDAYSGDTTFYRTAEADPIADAYGKIFKDLFTPIDQAPVAISAQFRYPEQIFDVQSEIFASVHVNEPSAYYNGEDRWAVPQEQVGGQPARMEPYYVTMTLPGETSPEFALIRPFTPGGRTDRQNMTAWMAGRVGPNGQLSLVVYRFPRQATVFGPRQIEARIDQEPEISAQITLWSQSGSRVIRGNLLVIPVEQSIIYVQPLYLEATQTQGALPELKRVIVASNEKVVMEPTLKEALAALVAAPAQGSNVGSLPATSTEKSSTSPPAQQTIDDLAGRASEAYARGEAALAIGDWTAYGQAQADLKAALDSLLNASGGTPVPAPEGLATPAPE